MDVYDHLNMSLGDKTQIVQSLSYVHCTTYHVGSRHAARMNG